MRKAIVAIVLALSLLVPLASSAWAINDFLVPADECSPSQSSAVGNPGGGSNPGIAQADPVRPPVSDNNPGESTGAKGQANSQAPANCN
jgi:hypothetical protein